MCKHRMSAGRCKYCPWRGLFSGKETQERRCVWNVPVHHGSPPTEVVLVKLVDIAGFTDEARLKEPIERTESSYFCAAHRAPGWIWRRCPVLISDNGVVMFLAYLPALFLAFSGLAVGYILWCRDSRHDDFTRQKLISQNMDCLLYTSPSPRDS